MPEQALTHFGFLVAFSPAEIVFEYVGQDSTKKVFLTFFDN